MSITNNQYAQLRDYLTQISSWSYKQGIPRITQKDIAQRLDVDQSGVSKFLSGKTQHPHTMLCNFCAKYPNEFNQWPQGAEKIQRFLQKNDVFYFLNNTNKPLDQARFSLPANQTPVIRPPISLSNQSQQGRPSLPIQPAPTNLMQPSIPSGHPTSLIPNNIGQPISPSNLPQQGRPLLPIQPAPTNSMQPGIPLGHPTSLIPSNIGQPISFSNLPQQGKALLPIQPAPTNSMQPGVLLGHPSIPISSNLSARPKLFAMIRNVEKASIAISYRGHESLKDAEGMLYDHMCFQTATSFRTAVVISNNANCISGTQHFFQAALNSHIAQLPFGLVNADQRRSPPFVQTCHNLGLLVIPGRPRKTENEPIRLAHEYRIIRDALNRGQPILGICAGTWRLWEQLRIWVEHPNDLNRSPTDLVAWHNQNASTVTVTDHTYTTMIRLVGNGTVPGYNKQIHDIHIVNGSLLQNALSPGNGRIITAVNRVHWTLNPHNGIARASVNSVHWKAVNGRAPLNTRISATAVRDINFECGTRQKTMMTPQENTAEAFENISGVPLFGIQWHPEAYATGTHTNLLKYMALTGNAYLAKRKMLDQFMLTAKRIG